MHDESWREKPFEFALCSLLMGLNYLIICWFIKTKSIALNTFMFLLILGFIQFLIANGLWHSDDINRYILEGKQILSGINPYSVAPEVDINKGLISQEILNRINHPDMTAIYPPVSLLIHAAMALVSPSIEGFTVLTCLGAFLLIFFSLKLLIKLKLSPSLIFILQWNPVLIIFGVGEAHNDIWVSLLLVIFIYVVSLEKNRTSWLFLAMAILAKPFAAILTPVYFLKNRKGVWILLITGVVFYLPFLNAGYGLLNSLLTFSNDMHFHSVIEPLFRTLFKFVMPEKNIAFCVRVCLLLCLIISLFFVWKKNNDKSFHKTILYCLAALLICLPTLHPWYFIILLPFLMFYQGWALLVWTAMAGAYWLHGLKMLEVNHWVEDPWVTAFSHLPAMVLLIIEFFRWGVFRNLNTVKVKID